MSLRRALVGALTVVVGVLCVVPWPPAPTDFAARLSAPSPAHPFGTDHLGRDVLARVLGGVPYSVGLGLVAVVGCAVVGTVVGLVSSWRDGPVARATQGAVDLLVALPTLLVGLVVVAAAGPGTVPTLLAVVLTGWAPFARQAHRLGVAERDAGHVRAAVSLGAGPVRLLRHHVLPALVAPSLAVLAARYAGTVVTVAGLSFLGLGIQPPTPEWGAMLAEGRTYAFVAPWLVAAPAGSLLLCTLGLAALARGHGVPRA